MLADMTAALVHPRPSEGQDTGGHLQGNFTLTALKLSSCMMKNNFSWLQHYNKAFHSNRRHMDQKKQKEMFVGSQISKALA